MINGLNNITFKHDHNAMWVLLLHHISTKGDFFTPDNVKDITSENLYSRLKYLENYRFNSQFEFLLEYPQLSGYNRWIQTSNPCTDGYDVKGFQEIDLTWKDIFSGLVLSSDSEYSFLDGNEGLKINNWCFAIGSFQEWQTFPGKKSIPGPFSAAVQPDHELLTEVKLWVRFFQNTCAPRFLFHRIYFLFLYFTILK